MEITDWSDLRQFDDFNTSEGKNANDDLGTKDKHQQSTENANEKDETGASGAGVTDWNDLRKFDDDHDEDWFSAQEKKLAEQYGGNFIKVKYASHGRVLYFCELCVAECNAKKSLELHCSGMKHLKKKDVWEKEGRPQGPLLGIRSEGGPQSSNEPPSKGSRDRDRRDGRRSPFRGRSKDQSGPPRGGRDRSRSRDRRPPWERERERDRRRRSYSKERGLNRGRDFVDRERDDRYFRDPFPRDSFNDPMRPGSRDRGRFTPDRSFESFDIDRGDRMRGYGRDREERFDEPMNRMDVPPPRPRYFGDRFRDPQMASNDQTPMPPSPPAFNSRPIPPIVEKANLVSSPAGSLLQKLSECCVKSSDDADLAMNVVASLTKSLKDYSQRNGENKIAELLMEAELKIGTVKALKVGMKMLSSFADTSKSKLENRAEIDFLNTMKRTQEEKELSSIPRGGFGSFGPQRPNERPSSFRVNTVSNNPQSSFTPSEGYPDQFSQNARQMGYNPPPPRSNVPWMG